MPEPQARPAAQLKSISPQFAVPDVVVAAEYYRDKLGFKILGYFLDPPSIASWNAIPWKFIWAGSNLMQLSLPILSGVAADSMPTSGSPMWILCWRELKERGANIVEPPTVRVYNCYEMVVKDIYGFRLAFAMDFQNP